MRIIAGELKGRQFEALKGHKTHPMSEKMRGAIFSALGDISELKVLDAFSGSGALSFEAISRGAKEAVALEIDKKAKKLIELNAKNSHLTSKVKVIRANASSWSDNNLDQTFDLIICDPPYDNLQINLLKKLTKHLKKSGIYVLSWPGDKPAPEFELLENIKEKNYSDATLLFYKKLE
jgi:16S rRNA (guanine966-N2)-methyltransferase